MKKRQQKKINKQIRHKEQQELLEVIQRVVSYLDNRRGRFIKWPVVFNLSGSEDLGLLLLDVLDSEGYITKNPTTQCRCGNTVYLSEDMVICPNCLTLMRVNIEWDQLFVL